MLINGAFADSIDATDRGLAYGDGLFETIRIAKGRPVLLDAHMQRLRLGCETLDIEAPIADIEGDFHRLLSDNRTPDAVLKVIVTRGVSGRGYKSRPGGQPNRIVSISEYFPDEQSCQAGVSTMLCETRLGLNPGLAGIKHLNRLEQVMASGELPDECHEGLMMNQAGDLIEGTKTNLFVVDRGELVTPVLDDCGVNGIMRQFLLERMPCSVTPVSMEKLAGADEVFVCNSVIGVWPVIRLMKGGETSFTWPVGPITKSARQLVEEETGISG